MSHTFYVSSEEAAEFFSNDRQKQDNKICCDCSAPNPPWASVSNGIYLCLECATQHRSFGVQASLVRSLTLDKWTLQQLKYMECGGNAELRRYYADNGLALTGPQVDRYTSKQAVAYREMLKVKAIAAATTESPPLVLPDIVHSEKPFNRPNASHSSPNIFHSERLSSSPSSSNKPEGTEESSKFALGEKIQSMQKGLEKVTETTKKAASTAAIKIQEAHLTDRLRSSSAKGWSSLQSGWTAAVSSLQKDKKSPAILITEEKLAAVSSEGSPNLAESEANDGIDPLSDSARPTLGVKLSDVSSQLHQASGKGWAVMKEYWEVAQAKVKTRTDTSATGSTIIDPPLSDGGSPDVARSDHGVADTNSSSLQDNHPNRAQEEAAPMSDDDDVGDKLHSPSWGASPVVVSSASSRRSSSSQKSSHHAPAKIEEVDSFLSNFSLAPRKSRSNSVSPAPEPYRKHTQDAVQHDQNILDSPTQTPHETEEIESSQPQEITSAEPNSPATQTEDDDIQDWHIVVPPISSGPASQ